MVADQLISGLSGSFKPPVRFGRMWVIWGWGNVNDALRRALPACRLRFRCSPHEPVAGGERSSSDLHAKQDLAVSNAIMMFLIELRR